MSKEVVEPLVSESIVNGKEPFWFWNDIPKTVESFNP